MIESITPDRIANAVLQDNSYNGLYIFVEGEKDYMLYSKFMNLSNVRIKPTFGCQKLLDVFKILNLRGYDKKIGILDKDFFEIIGNTHQLENVFYTDFHDVEIMIFVTKAFYNMLRIYTIKEKIEKIEKKTGKEIRELIFELSDRIGYLKLVETKNKYGLTFKPEYPDGNQIKYHDFISDKFEYQGDDILINTIINYSRNKTEKKLNFQEIKNSYIKERGNIYDSRHLSNGHDVSNIVFILLKKTFRSNNNMLNDFKSIENSLILAYEFEDFKKTELYKNIQIWSEGNNQQIFRDN